MPKRNYRDVGVEKSKLERRKAVAERFRCRTQIEDLKCSVCGEGILYKVKLIDCTLQFCDRHFRDFSRLASFLAEDMRDEGIQHPDQGKFPERLAAALGQPTEQPVVGPVQVYEANGEGTTGSDPSGESLRPGGSTAG